MTWLCTNNGLKDHEAALTISQMHPKQERKSPKFRTSGLGSGKHVKA